MVGVGVGPGVRVGVGVFVGSGVDVGVLVGVSVGVLVGVLVGVSVGVLVGLFVGVSVGVLVGVPVTSCIATSGRFSPPCPILATFGAAPLDGENVFAGPGPIA